MFLDSPVKDTTQSNIAAKFSMYTIIQLLTACNLSLSIRAPVNWIIINEQVSFKHLLENLMGSEIKKPFGWEFVS